MKNYKNQKSMAYLVALAGLVACSCAGMTHNLLHPWQNPPRCSPPQTPLYAFYNREQPDMMFNDGREIEIWCQAAIRASELKWSLHHNRVNAPLCEGIATEHPGNLFSIKVPVENLRPGFYDVRVQLDCGFAQIKLLNEKRACDGRGIATFGWKADRMEIVNSRPADFDAFWKESIDAYRKLPLDLRIESEKKIFKGKEIDDYNVSSACLPPRFDKTGVKYDEVVSYKVSWAGPDGGRVYAWLARPNVEGVKFPAMLVLPGAGTGGRPRPLEHARHGYLAIDVQVHGFDVEVEGSPKVPGYNGVPPLQYENPKKYCWHNIYLRALRGVEALIAMKEVDAGKIVAVGGSQGGRLSYVVSSLDNRVAATIPCISHGANMPHLEWIRQLNGAHKNGANEWVTLNGSQKEKCEAYFDPMNFSPLMKNPIYANAGLIDPVSPAFATWAVWKRAGSADKTYVPVPGHGHDWWSGFDKLAYKWLEKTLK